MNIRHVENKHVNRKKWDTCVQNSINMRIYATSWYLEMVSEDWDALVLNDYEAVMPLPFRKKNALKYVYPPFFAPQMGIFSKTGVSEDLTKAFLKAIPSRFFVVEMRLNSQMKVEGEMVLENSRTFLLDMIEPYEQLRARFSKNIKRNIKKAENAGLSIMKTGSVSDIIRLFVGNKASKNANFEERDYARLIRIVNIFVSLKMGHLWMVYDSHNTLQAGAFFIQYLGYSAFLFSGRGANSSDNGAMHFLINEYIKENSGKNIVFDFCGSNDDNLARFYAGFGAIPSYYQVLQYFPGNSMLKKTQYKLYKWLKSKM